MQSTGINTVGNGQNHGATFAKVRDGRKQPIRGLWIRNGRFYAQLAFESGETGEKKVRRVPLLDDEQKPVTTVPQAIKALDALKTDRSRNSLPVLHRTPRFKDFKDTYLNFINAGAGQKKATTIYKEEKTLAKWAEQIGGVRLDKIRMAHINAYKTKRLAEGCAPRTVNLDVIVLNNVLNHAIDEKHIRELPTANLRPLKVAPKVRTLFARDGLDRLCASAVAKQNNSTPVTKNGEQFADYLRFLAYCGAREKEALAVRWKDVDFDSELLTIGAAEATKNHKARTVDFNPKLAALLHRMHKRRAPDSQWLFPSPQRGNKDIHTKTFRESLKLTRTHAKLPHVAFHDLRHHFISYCVMSGVDFMTIASWVGHQDGGVLIGKVYGHLANEHKKTMAAKLDFGTTKPAKAANV